MPKFLTSSTLFYSGIFAAAATWDAGAKKHRREQWDKAIADVKQELGQAAETVGQYAQHAENADRRKGGEATVLYTPDVFEDVEPHKRKSRWPTNTGPELKIHRLPPESIYATEERKTRSESRRWSPKKLETVMLSVDAMQLQMFIEMQRHLDEHWRQAASAAVPIEYRDKMFLSPPDLHASLRCKMEDIKRIRAADPDLSGWRRSTNDVPLSDFRQDDQGSYYDTVRQLNSCLQDLFRQHKPDPTSTPSLLAKIAYNLSISSAPPNVHTYNTLILGMSDIKQTRIVNQVVRSLRETHIRLNEMTNVAVLNHLTATDNAAGFVKWIELMRGKHNGLALARPDIRINEAGASRLLRVKRDSKDDKVIQLPYPTSNAFGALVKGVLKFSGFETALKICEGMGHEGWALCMGGLTPLLVHCANNADWNSGLAVWRQIQALKARSNQRYAHQKWTPEKVPPDAFAAMVRLCARAGQKVVFQDIWAQAMRADVQSARTLAQLVKAQNEAATEALAPRPAMVASDGQREISLAEQDESKMDSTDNPSTEAEVRTAAEIIPVEHHEQPTNSVNILRELQTSGIPAARGRDIARQGPTRERNVLVALQPAPAQPTILLREQLNGLLPAGHELDDYEMRERPMSMYG